MRAKDPGAVAGCPTPTPALLSSPLGRIERGALAATFVRSERTALFVVAGVLALAALLVPALPRPERMPDHPRPEVSR